MDQGSIEGLARKCEGEVAVLRRHFHEYPEKSWQEEETLEYIRTWLIRNGLCGDLNIREGRGGMWCDLTVNPGGPFVIFRADLDALAIHEANDVSYRSKNDGMMHACGHDCNLAMLLIAMREIANIVSIGGKDGCYPCFNIRFVFQRSEEDFTASQGSGGRVMVEEDGVCENVVSAIALHVWSERPNGFWTRPGTLFVNSDRVELVIRTKGGHAGLPHRAENALDYMDDAIPEIRQWPQRLVPYEEGPAIISHTVCHAGRDLSGANVVPIEARRCWSVRTGTEKARQAIYDAFLDLQDRLKDRNIRVDLNYICGHPATILNPAMVAKTAALLGDEVHVDHPVIPGGEDFGHYCGKVPSAFYMLGTGGIPGKTDIPHHRANFDVDERQLWRGVWFWMKMAFGLEL